MNEIANLGDIITFYSFKGGTGRSMTLVNTAILLSRLAKNVLIIDWDLEAPGIHKFLDKYVSEENASIKTKSGLIDFFIKIDTDKNRIKEFKSFKEFEVYFSEINFSDFIVTTNIEGISFIKAGLFNNDYIELINNYNWQRIYGELPLFFKMFAFFLKSRFDYIFIDSRTGYTDTSGICTMILPDKLCLVFTTNSQSLEGVVNLAKRALNYRMNSEDFRPLKIFPIPSRVELAEKDLRDLWRKGSDDISTEGYQPAFENIFRECYDIKSPDLTDYFNSIQIHHEPKYSYGEEIAVLSESFTDKLSLTTAYTELVQKLLYENQIFTNFNADNKNDTKIFISYTYEDKLLAEKLLLDLNTMGFATNGTLLTMAKSPYFDDVANFISNCNVYIPVISNAYMESSFSDLESNFIIKSRLTNHMQSIIPIYYEYDEKHATKDLFYGFKGIYVDDLLLKRNFSKYTKQLAEQLFISITNFIAQIREENHLTAKEIEFLRLATTELTYKQIAEQMRVSVQTVDGYRDKLFLKLQIKSRVGLVLYAIKNNIVTI